MRFDLNALIAWVLLPVLAWAAAAGLAWIVWKVAQG